MTKNKDAFYYINNLDSFARHLLCVETYSPDRRYGEDQHDKLMEQNGKILVLWSILDKIEELKDEILDEEE